MSRPSCGCNFIYETATGGISVGGAAVDPDFTGSGGVTLGATATVDMPGNLYDGMAGVWLLQEASSPYYDKSDYGLDGTAKGAGDITRITGVFCLYAQSFEDDAWIETALDSVTGDFSLSMWVRLTDTNFRSANLMDRGEAFLLSHSLLNHVWARLNYDDDTIFSSMSATMLERNRWYNVGITWDTHKLRIYINGVLDKTEEADDTLKTLTGVNLIMKSVIGDCLDVRLFHECLPPQYFEALHANYCDNAFYTAVEQTPT